MKALRMAIRQLWEKVDRRAKKEHLEALEARISLLERAVADLRKEKTDA